MKKRSLLITLLSLILTFSVSIGLTTSIAYAEETPVEYSMGDANLDGNVNTRDVVLIKQSIVGLTELNDKQKVFADVYADGQINTRDVVLIQQSIVGMDVDLGVHEHSFENGVCICGKQKEVQDGKTCVVTFCDWDGSVFIIDGQELKMTVDYGTVLNAETVYAPEKDGYRFDGWQNWTDEVITDITLIAKYVKQYTIKFLDYDGSLYRQMVVDEGCKLDVPQNPSRIGYRFSCWDVDIEGKEIYNDHVLTAIYIKQYTVKFIGAENGNDFVIEVDEGTSIDEVLTNAPAGPSVEGYDFIEWQTKIANKEIFEDIVFAPNYQIKTYTVTFKDNLGNTISKIENVKHGMPVDAPPVEKYWFNWDSKVGYEFSGWDKDTTRITYDLEVCATYLTKVEQPIIYVEQIIKKQGETSATEISGAIAIEVYIFGVDSLCGMNLELTYDSKMVLMGENPVSVNEIYNLPNDTSAAVGINKKDRKIKFSWAGEVLITNVSRILTVRLGIEKSADIGFYSVSLSENSYIIDSNIQKVEPVLISGGVNLIKGQ